jgi:hypothetical protein
MAHPLEGLKNMFRLDRVSILGQGMAKTVIPVPCRYGAAEWWAKRNILQC